MSRIVELLEKFEDTFKPTSDEELKQRIEQIDEDDLQDAIEDALGDVDFNTMVDLWDDLQGTTSLAEKIYDDLIQYTEMMIEEDEIGVVRDFLFDIMKRKRNR
ncbi:MAG: hypothetical protein ACTSU7_15140 [Candidatus Heimdallarchaeaceae archaeon]